jgi:hypothetical protein
MDDPSIAHKEPTYFLTARRLCPIRCLEMRPQTRLDYVEAGVDPRVTWTSANPGSYRGSRASGNCHELRHTSCI